MTRVPSKALLCFHGTGSKGAIFNVQMARICYLLGDAFEFIFLDGPMECAAGPGVLPMFGGQEPYYCWFGGDGTTIDESLKKINAAVKLTVDKWQAGHPDVEIVGAIGFSEGALALAMMLWQQQQGLVPWIGQLRFAVMSCCFFPNEASLWLNARAQAYGLSKAYIDIPTLHIHGNRDFCLGRARKLVRNHYRPSFAQIIRTDTAHHLPTRKDEVGEVVKHILRLSEMSAIDMAS
ncbi:DUF341 domain protein [Aspergillus fijiensis CBS 313.89]|uniref:DUF341 domain protein n=1 Tax=Aspergillus fijiensis CBS 313.89 TaxID=1448319 RepID=A0A8G1VY07_9EURO|nr:DUF341 domain protein [Aspergillus fijiensis CBS 313.89]RAK77235.1 DUF341 domain protein [Aspergillus fijiensis CBS 313.89]